LDHPQVVRYETIPSLGIVSLTMGARASNLLWDFEAGYNPQMVIFDF